MCQTVSPGQSANLDRVKTAIVHAVLVQVYAVARFLAWRSGPSQKPMGCLISSLTVCSNRVPCGCTLGHPSTIHRPHLASSRRPYANYQTGIFTLHVIYLPSPLRQRWKVRGAVERCRQHSHPTQLLARQRSGARRDPFFCHQLPRNIFIRAKSFRTFSITI